MRKFIYGLLVLAVAACTKEYHYHYDDAGNEIPDPSGVVEEPVSSTDGSITVNLVGPENWFGNAGPSLTGKGDPQQQYSTGPYTVELHKSTVSNTLERVTYVQDVYTDGDAPVFDSSVVEEGTDYTVMVFPDIDNSNPKFTVMWDEGFDLSGKGGLAFNGGDITANVTIAPHDISQFVVTGDAYKVTFRQWTIKSDHTEWYQWHSLPGYLSDFVVDPISFIAPHTDSSVYWNVAGVPDTEDLDNPGGKTNDDAEQRYRNVPPTYDVGVNKGLLEIIIQPRITSAADKIQHYWIGDNGGVTAGLENFDAEKVLIKNPLANKNYELPFDIYSNTLSVNIISVDMDNSLFDGTSSVVSTTSIEDIPFSPADEDADAVVAAATQFDWTFCSAGVIVDAWSSRVTGTTVLSENELYYTIPRDEDQGATVKSVQYDRANDQVVINWADNEYILAKHDSSNGDRGIYKCTDCNGNAGVKWQVVIRKKVETAAWTGGDCD